MWNYRYLIYVIYNLSDEVPTILQEMASRVGIGLFSRDPKGICRVPLRLLQERYGGFDVGALIIRRAFGGTSI